MDGDPAPANSMFMTKKCHGAATRRYRSDSRCLRLRWLRYRHRRTTVRRPAKQMDLWRSNVSEPAIGLTNSSFPSDEVGPLVTRPKSSSTVSFKRAYDRDRRHRDLWRRLVPGMRGANSSIRVHAGGRSGRGCCSNGNILFAASPGNWTTSGAVSKSDPINYEMDLNTNQITQVPDTSWAVEHELLSVQFRWCCQPVQILATDIDGSQRHPDLHARRHPPIELATGHHLGALVPRRQRNLYVERHAIERADRRFVLR